MKPKRLTRTGETTKDVRLYRVGDIIPLSHCPDHDKPQRVGRVDFTHNQGSDIVYAIYLTKGSVVITHVNGHVKDVCIDAEQRFAARQKIHDVNERLEHERLKRVKQIKELKEALRYLKTTV